MYFSRVDSEEICALWVFDATTPDEWDAHFEDIREYIASFKPGRRGASLIVASDFSRPDAKRRATLTELTGAANFDPHVAFVNPNAALRAILAVFGWMQRAPKYEMDFFGTTANAFSWLEKRRGTKLATLESNLAQVRAEYRAAKGRDLP